MYATFAENATTLLEGDDASYHRPSETASNITTHSIFGLMDQQYDISSIEGKLKDIGLSTDYVDQVYSCSPTQENIYIARQMGSSNLYWTQSVYEIHPCYTYSEIRDAWLNIIHRHEALRTLYFETTDKTSERILDAVVLSRQAAEAILLTVIDQRGDFDHKPAPLEASAGTRRDMYHRVTISSDTMVHGDIRTLITIDLDHMIVDLSSLMIVIDEFGRSLQGQLSSENWPTGYGKFIEYVGPRIQQDQALDYWVDYLESAKPCLFPLFCADELDAGQRDSMLQGGSSESIDISLVTPLTRVREFCQRMKITIATAIEATWAQVLYMYTGQDDVCFGHISSGRDLPVPGLIEVVGPVMSLLVTCVQDIAEKSIHDLVSTIRDDYINALSQQCFSLRKVQRILGNNDRPLFNTVVNTMYHPRVPQTDDGEWSLKFVASHNASEYDVVIKAVYTEVDLKARLAYSSRALSCSMATHVAHMFASVLDEMVNSVLMEPETFPKTEALLLQPSAQVSEILKASPYDIQQIFTSNNQDFGKGCPKQVLETFESSSCPSTIIEMIVSRANRQPHSPAIYSWDGCMTYSELDTASTKFARLILAASDFTKSSESFDYIPLCFEKSKWYSVALLGVLKSGKAFVPLDMDSNPEDRVRSMLGRLHDPNLVVCSTQNAAKCSKLAKNILVCDEHTLKNSCNYFCNADLLQSRPTDPAYIIFTVSWNRSK